MEIESRPQRGLASFVINLSCFIIPFTVSSVNIALPSLGTEFSMDAVLLGWVTTAYLAAVGAFLVPLGRLADIHGRKAVFLWGVIVYTFSSVFCGLSVSPVFLITFRALQGIGAAGILSTGLAILTSIFPAGERGRVLGINVATVYSGLSCGPLIGGILVYHFGWRAVFLVTPPAGVIIILFTLLRMKGEWVEAHGERFDLVGSLLYGLALLAIVYGFSLLPRLQGVFSILLGFFGIFTFIKWEVRLKEPIFNVHLFGRNRVFAFSNVAALINYSATYAVTLLLSLYLQYIKGLNAQQAGTVLLVQPLVQAVFSPFAGKMSDRIEPGLVASAGMGLTAAGLFLFIFMGEGTSSLFIVANLAVMGLGFALFSSPNMNAIMGSVEKRFYGVASGTLGTMRSSGMMFSMAVVMLIFALYMGRIQITASVYPLFIKSIKVAFGIFSGLCLVGILPSISRGRVHSKSEAVSKRSISESSS